MMYPKSLIYGKFDKAIIYIQWGVAQTTPHCINYLSRKLIASHSEINRLVKTSLGHQQSFATIENNIEQSIFGNC